LADQRRPGARARTLVSAALALVAHLVLITALVVGIRVVHPPPDSPPLVVTLTRLFLAPPKPAPRPVAPPARPPARSAAPAAGTAAPPPAPPPPVALPENGPIDPRLAAAEAVRGALQGVVRCAHPDAFDLSPAERAACARLNRQMAGAPPTYVVDPADHARHDPPVASHGMAAHIGPLSPRPGYDLGRLR